MQPTDSSGSLPADVASSSSLGSAEKTLTKPFGPFAPASAPDVTTAIKNVDMPEEMQQYALKMAVEGLLYQNTLREIAGHVKRSFDSRFGPMWHCVAGKSYGCYCTHEAGSFIFFYVDTIAITLFKTV